MPNHTIVLGLEVSSRYIRYCYVRRTQKKISLLKKGKLFSQDSAFVKDSTSLTETIREIQNKEGLRPSRICLALAGEDLFIHQINLPRIPDTEINEIIGDEIKRVPKFTTKEFDYTYAVSKLTEKTVRILFCAVPKESLNLCIEGVQRTGVCLESLGVGPLNLLELLSSKITKDKIEIFLVLDDNSSYLVIFWQGECKLFFQMTTGAFDLYTVKGAINNLVFLPWIEEIKRILKSYRRETDARLDIEKLWFIWDSENSEEVATLMAAELGVEIIIPTAENFALQLAEKDGKFNPLLLLSLAGPLLYLNGLKQRFNFKYFLEKVKFKKIVQKIGLFVGIYILLAGTLLGIISVNCLLAKNTMLADEKRISLRIATLEKKTADLRKERDAYLQTRTRLLKQATVVKMLNRVSWSEVIGKTGLALPDDVSLSSVSVYESGRIDIVGTTFKIDSVAELIRKINAVGIFSDVKFNFLREKEIKNKKIVEFGVFTKLIAGGDEGK